MSLLVETLRVENGNILNVTFHNERVKRSLYDIYGMRSYIDLNSIINVPASVQRGIFKCRVVYDNRSTRVEFLPYTVRQVRTLKLIVDENICYPYKYIARDKINRLYEMKGDCDDILIIKGGFVTDSSSANIIFREPGGRWVTPSTYLLSGTRRASLLKAGLISEASITSNKIQRYTHVKLINAMLGIEDTEDIPIESIVN